MRASRAAFVSLMLCAETVLGVACGRDWAFLEPGPDAQGADADAHAPGDATADARPEAAPESGADGGDAAATEAAAEASVDAHVDAGIDATGDATTDATGDVGTDGDAAVTADAFADAQDASADVAADTGADAGADGSVDAPPGDGGPDASPLACDVTKPFTSIRLVGGVNTANDEQGATLLPDEKTIYVASGVWHVTFDLYAATRAAAGLDFGAPVLVPGASAGDYVIGAAVTVDGNTLYLDSYYPNVSARHIQLSTRAGAGQAFGTPTIITELESANEEGSPYVLPSGGVLYFTSSRSGHFDIYRAAKGDAGTFDPPTPVDSANDPNFYDAYPVVTPDELTIYFGSARVKTGFNTDIYVARRSTTTAPFGTPVPVPELASPALNNIPTWLSPDACRLYLVSDRPSDAGTSGSRDVWVAERSP
jgi:hypothetical protein